MERISNTRITRILIKLKEHRKILSYNNNNINIINNNDNIIFKYIYIFMITWNTLIIIGEIRDTFLSSCT